MCDVSDECALSFSRACEHACTHAVVDLAFSGDITIDRIGDLGRGPRDFVAFRREEPRRQSVCAVRGISRSQLVLNRFARCLARHCLRWPLVGGARCVQGGRAIS